MKNLLRNLLLLISASACIAIIIFWRSDLSESYLVKKYSNASSRLIEIEGSRIHMRDTGNPQGPVILLIHGFGASLHTWENWSSELEKDYRVIRFDLPGSGLSGPDQKLNYSDERSIQIILGLLETLKVKKINVVGNSIGGRIAWYFTAMHPERVDKLVLISPDGFKSFGRTYNKSPEIPGYLSMINYIFPKFVFRKNLEFAYFNQAVLTYQLFDRYYELALYPGNRQAMIDRMRQTVLKDPVPFLKKIHSPVLLLWGETDAMIPVQNAKDYMALMPQADLQVLQSMGHLPQEEDPPRSLSYLLKFLKTAPSVSIH
jgi:pimeloyl-ACP methyl ester carboxylesterase